MRQDSSDQTSTDQTPDLKAEEIRLAFEHPQARSEATAAQPLDRLMVRDHVVDVEIGAFQAERDMTQRVRFNVVVEILPLPADLDDDVDRILSYDKVTEAIAFELGAERLNLLETLAERIADRILSEPQACRVFVRIEKLDRGPFDLGVEIVRSAGEGASATEAATPEVPPQLAFLANTAITAPHLTGWIDQLVAEGAPLVLCVGPHDLAVPGAATDRSQRHISLLAIEQNAWVLAARDPRLAVVETRTELDWAVKNGQICVWAPSKIVLDSPDTQAAPPSDPVALSAWFANWLGARNLTVIGADIPKAQGLEMRAVSEEQKDL